MCLKNTEKTYGIVAKTLHWLMALLIIGMIALGFIMADMEKGPDKFKLFGLHKSIGITILILAVVRLIWKLINVAPTLPASLKPVEKKMAHGGHAILYLLMFLTPLSGWFMSSAAGFPVSVFGWFTLPNFIAPDKALKEVLEERHTMLAWGIIIMVTLHVLAALMHHFYHKNDVLKRMLPTLKSDKNA